MKMTLKEIAMRLNGHLIGDENIIIECLSSIDNIKPGSLVFAEGALNLARAEASEARVLLVSEETVSDLKPVIQVKHPFQAFMTLLTLFYPPEVYKAGIHPTAVIGENVFIDKDVFIGPYVTIENDCHIHQRSVIHSHVAIGHHSVLKAYTTLHPHVTIYPHTHIGERVTIHAGTVIGSDGFGYVFFNNAHQKVPHVGSVVIQNDVEIGANTTIDKATIGETVIGEGTKIDNLVQVAHSVKLGRHNIVCAFTGIAGSTKSGDRVIFAANVGVSDHVTIEDDVILTARAGVPSKKQLKKGVVYLGNPARPKDKAIENELAITRIPIIRRKVQALTDRVDALYAQMNYKEKDEA